MSFRIRFYKDRQKFSAAHFTLFDDGEAERLHGHNYMVEAAFEGETLERGLLFPFHLVKPELNKLCAEWDERVLLPTASDWVSVTAEKGQCEVRLKTPRVEKRYSFPETDVALLPVNNVSSENLAALFLDRLIERVRARGVAVKAVAVTISESLGQEATCRRTLG